MALWEHGLVAMVNVGLVVGLSDLRRLFQPEWFYYSVITSSDGFMSLTKVPSGQFIMGEETACLITWACPEFHSAVQFTVSLLLLSRCLGNVKECYLGNVRVLDGALLSGHARINHKVRSLISCRCQHNSVLLVMMVSSMQKKKKFQMCMVVGR